MDNLSPPSMISIDNLKFFINHYQILANCSTKMQLISKSFEIKSELIEILPEKLNILFNYSKEIDDLFYDNKLMSFIRKHNIAGIKKRYSSIKRDNISIQLDLLNTFSSNLKSMSDELKNLEELIENTVVEINNLDSDSNDDFIYIKQETINLVKQFNNLFSYLTHLLETLYNLFIDVFNIHRDIGELENKTLDEFLELQKDMQSLSVESKKIRTQINGLEDYKQEMLSHLSKLELEYIEKFEPIYKKYGLECLV